MRLHPTLLVQAQVCCGKCIVDTKNQLSKRLQYLCLKKKQLDRWSKQDRDEILNALKRGVSQLTRIRHPQVLVVHHPAEDSRDSLAFATEPVFASLANILGKIENTSSPPNPQLKNYKLFEVEIKYGLLQIGEGLAFLHNDAKILHHNLCPENIVINQQGAWKIFGFDFSIQKSHPDSTTWPWLEYKSDLHPLAQPELDYLAPECVLLESNTAASDVYSLGVMIYALYNEGQPLFSANKDLHTYKQNINKIKQLPASGLMSIVEGLREMVRMMLNFKPELRPDEHELIKVEFFDDVGVKTLNYLDSLFQWDNLQKSQFYKGLPQIVDKLPHRVCLYRVIPCLIKEFVNPTMVPFVLPNVLIIAENCSKEEFSQHILPTLKTVMKMTDPIQILLIFMQKMDLLLKLTPSDEVKMDVLPMLYRALESDAQQIQELCLSVLPTYAVLIDYPSMKNALLPRIKRLCMSTSYISVRVNCLVCLGKLLEHLDKWLVLDEILPFLPQIPSREPAVLMGILGIYKLVLSHKQMVITKEVMATKVLPFLMPLSIENALTLNQFNAIIAVIKEMVNRVETEHRVKLEQLNSIQNEQKALDSSMNLPPPAQLEIEQILGMKSPSGDIKTFTIDDKQRFIREQEATQRLHSEPAINPSKATVVKPLPQTRDLTSTLMENNLNQMVISPTQQPTKAWVANPLPIGNPHPVGNHHPTPPTIWPSTTPNNTNSNPMMAWQSTNMQTMPIRQPYNFPVASFPVNKVPMNSMPTLNPNSNKPFQQQQQPPTKQLSASEINDFLS
uniref:Protein kinase domain-containing protein n=1 Tax=Clastoptera arizonana TaxID=38151 RepID=A0A1B6C9B0_9HEMI